MKNIAVFASGSGTNMKAIYDYLATHPEAGQIKLVLSNRENAYVLERARLLNITNISFNTYDIYHSNCVLNVLKKAKIDFVVLAGFLLLIPENILQEYHNRIVNIHPALLPKYGGKGMYGKKVHEAVIQAREKESGITIHYVNEQYDAGDIIFQAKCTVEENETPETLAEKIHNLEHEFYPQIIKQLLSKL